MPRSVARELGFAPHRVTVMLNKQEEERLHDLAAEWGCRPITVYGRFIRYCLDMEVGGTAGFRQYMEDTRQAYPKLTYDGFKQGELLPDPRPEDRGE